MCRRVRRHHLGAHPTGRLLDRHLLHRAEEGVARQHDRFQLQFARFREVDLGGGRQVSRGDHGPQRLDQHARRLRVVADRDLRADPPVVAQRHVHVRALTQPVRGVVAVGAEPGDVDDELERVECEGGADLLVHHAQAADLVDHRADGHGQTDGAVEQLLALLDHLPTPAVHRRVDQGGRTGRAEQILPRLEHVRIDPVTLEMEDRALLQAAAHLVHAGHAHVRAGVHPPDRQPFRVEGQVRAPCLVHDERAVMTQAHLFDTGQIGAGAVIVSGSRSARPWRPARPGTPPRRRRGWAGTRGAARRPTPGAPRPARLR